MEEYRVSREELLELLEARNRLAALESGGVDNWDWYSDSFHEYLKEDYENNREVYVKEFNIKEGETSPPKRYNSGSLILAMENAGELSSYEVVKE